MRLGDRSDAVRRAHYSLLRGGLTATGGIEVKNLGDGLMAIYDSAAGAVAGAVAIQRAVQRHNQRSDEPLSIRIGVSTGDVKGEDGDYFGIAVIEAARLCAAAKGDQALIADITRALCGGQSPAELVPLGALDLKGLEGPLTTWEVDWRGAGGPEADTLPGALARSAAAGWFVGRTAELDLLDAGWKRAVDGERRCMLLEGEPGVGKTRLAAVLATGVHTDDGMVTFGRCDPDVNTPFGPWVELLRRVVASADADLLGEHVIAHGGNLLRLVPELSQRLPEVPAPRPADPDTELLWLQEAVIDLLDAVAARQPLLVVLDDIHWADRPSLVLLRRWLRASSEARVLVVATYRDVAADQSAALRDIAGDLVREPRVERMALGGLDHAETTKLVEAAIGPAVDGGADLVDELHRETDGNPLFTTELLRHLVEGGAFGPEGDGYRLRVNAADLGMPGTVRDVVKQRVERLDEEAQRALRAAAVIGRTFDLDLLVHAANGDEDTLLDHLDVACNAALVDESTGTPGRFAFSHALIQRAVADGLGETRRARIHRRVAERLEELVDEAPNRLGELARHWIGAADRERAIAAAMRAGDRAIAVLAPEGAAHWFATGLELQGEGDDPLRCELLIRLGEAERLAGNEIFGEHLMEAGRLAERLGDKERQVRAALSNNRGMHSGVSAVDDQRVGSLLAALVAAGDDLAARAQLLATLASEHFFGADHAERVGLSDEALSIARGLGDDRILASVVYRRCLTVAEPGTVEHRLELTEELLELAERLGDPLTRLLASAERGRVAMEAGLGEEARRHGARQVELLPRCGAAFGRHVASWSKPWQLLLDARFEEAEAAAQEAFAESNSTGQTDAIAHFGAALLLIRWDQGRLGELAEALVGSLEMPDMIPANRATVAQALAECGRLDEAATLVADGAAGGFELPLNAVWLSGTVAWGDAAAHVGDAAARKLLLERLLPWRHQVAFWGSGNFGAAARVAGRLAALIGQHDQADDLFAEALALHERLPAPVFVARTQLDWGRALAARGEPEAAEPRLRAARDAAKRMGCADIGRRAGELLGSVERERSHR